ncbi:hypothetical protein BGZ91_009583 [Linnemannia elongata]|nr:hypothetical protein BGZ91_009583 [Linnemannia elongata]
MGTKKIHPTDPQWDNNTEQEIFGNQSPFAADSPSSNNSNNILPPPQQQEDEQYPPAGSSSSNYIHDPPAPPTDQPFIFPHYPTQQPYNPPYSQQPRPNNKGSLKDVQVPEDAPPMYTKEPTSMTPPPTLLSIPPPNATAPSSPSSATASAPPSAHPYSQPQVQPHPPQESLPRVLPVQTRQAPYHHPKSPVLRSPFESSTEQTPLSPQVYSPTAPISPRQDRPPPPAPQATPTSYGAIRSHPQGHSRSPLSSRPRTPPPAGNSDSESNSGSEEEEERIAAGERHRRRKAIKKHLSGCTCNKICWILIILVLLSFWTSPIEKTVKDPCTLMAERRLEPEIETYSLGGVSSKNLISLDIMEHILGDITIVEADNWSQEVIGVRVNKTLSHPDLDDIISFKIKFDPSYNNAALLAGLSSTDPAERERGAKIMKNHCARIDIEFVFPKYSDSIKRLVVRTQKGDIRIRTEGPTIIFKELHLETLVGDVFFEAGTVQTSTTIKTGRGKVQGTIRTLEKVEVSTAMGDIALVVDARPGLHGADNGKFNITLQSAKSSIDLGLSEKYTGLFSLESGIGKPTFGLSSNYTDTIQIIKSTATLLSGWVWDGYSDRPRSLPSVSATAPNGLVHVQVLDKHKNTK